MSTATMEQKAKTGSGRGTGFGGGGTMQSAGREKLVLGVRNDGRKSEVEGSESAVMPNEKPGALKGNMTLNLHTRYAAQLWRGRKPDSGKPAIRSVPHFGAILKTITRAAGADDPYADWYLLQIQEKLEAGRQKMQALEEQVEQFVLNRVPAEVSVADSLSQRAVVVDVHFESPLAYWMAYLVADYDRVVRRVQQALHFGLLPRAQSEVLMQEGAKIVRSLLSALDHWKFTGVTRDDMAANNQRAIKALDVMGSCPEAVLGGELRSLFAPPIRRDSALEKNSDLVLDD